MLMVQVYPVLDGVQVQLVANCVQFEGQHLDHKGSSVGGVVPSDSIEERGLAGAIALEVTLLVHEYSDLVERARC